jgi:aspartyl-tRNA synthetase
MVANRKYVEEMKENVGKKITLAGWVHDTRVLGSISFVILRDKTGKGQVTAVKSKVPSAVLKLIESLRQEDVISVEGKVVKSKEARAGFELIPEKIEVINKAETPLPLDPRNVTRANLDTQLDWRVLHMRTDEGRAIFRIQSQILKSFREFLIELGYIEIQPPIIISSASEGGAELFSMKYFEKLAYLAQSPQLYKQMCAIAFVQRNSTSRRT